MKSILLLLVTVFITHTAGAQFTITTGAQLTMTGPTQLTLQNISLINNGSFAAGNSAVRFTGDGPNSIGGTQPIQFGEMEMFKTGNGFVLLLRSISVKDDLLFSAGLLNLNGFNIDLGTTGMLINENDSSRVIGANGGELLFNVNLNAPVQVNPGNLGLFITTTHNLGNITIHRGHKAQINNIGNTSSIQRYYELLPINNADLNATLAFRYFDGELNNLPENSLSLFASDDAVSWKVLGFDTRNTSAHFIEKTRIGSLGRLTLFNDETALPVRFSSIIARCENNAVEVHWTTAQEQNIDHYSVDRTEDGNHWNAIGQLPSTGNVATETSYRFRDNSPVQNAYYRIAEYDLAGKIQYSNPVHSFCTPPDGFHVFPNPVRDKLFINLVSANSSTALLRLFDAKGALLKQQAVNILRDSNHLVLDMNGLPKGVYQVSVEWNNGHMKKTVPVVKE